MFVKDRTQTKYIVQRNRAVWENLKSNKKLVTGNGEKQKTEK